MQLNRARSPKQSPRNAQRYNGYGRGKNEETVGSSEKALNRNGSLQKDLKWSPKKPENGTVRNRNVYRKRKASISSASNVSYISSIGENTDDEADSEESSDDEDDLPADLTPSYESKTHQRRKTGSESLKSPLMNGNQTLGLLHCNDQNGYQSSDADSSDDDDAYGAVDDITDDDEEDLSVEKLEEQMIMESEDDRQSACTVFSLSLPGEGEDLPPIVSFDDSVLFSATAFLDEEQLHAAFDTFGETDLTSEAVETPAQKHVHFQESDSSPEGDHSTELTTDDEIPGDFLQQDSLDPTLRRMIENDNENPGDQGQRFDDVFCELDYSQSANIYHVESDAIVDSSSGYETDDGETTDEDLPPPATITHPKSILRRNSSASLPGRSTEASNPNSTPRRRRGPIMGTFVADPKVPVAVVDHTGTNLVIIPAYASARHDWLESANNSLSGTANNSPPATTMQVIDESDTDTLVSPTKAELSPMLTSSANLMISALGNDATSGGQVMGPPEAFYPSRTFGGDSSYEEDDDVDDDEAMLNVDDFIDFGNGSSDDEDKVSDEDELITSPLISSSVQAAVSPTSGFGIDSSQVSNAEQFLNHLDQGIVTAFRRNHNRYQALIRLPRHREFMPTNSPSRLASVFRHSRYSDRRTAVRKRKAGGYAGGEAVRRKLLDTHRRALLPL